MFSYENYAEQIADELLFRLWGNPLFIAVDSGLIRYCVVEQ
jgi:hypothetical protein